MQTKQAVSRIAEIKQFCELAGANLTSFTDEDWETSLEALDIHITVYPDRVDVEGSIPLVGKGAFVSDTSPSSR